MVEYIYIDMNKYSRYIYYGGVMKAKKWNRQTSQTSILTRNTITW